jgi:hypothetical protein
VQKGALIGLDPFNPLAGVTIFQYNPETLTRTLTPQTGGAQGGATAAPGDPLRLTAPPVETLKLDIVLDAADQLEKSDSTTVAFGVLPQLAALEMLLYPKSAYVITNEALLLAGVALSFQSRREQLLDGERDMWLEMATADHFFLTTDRSSRAAAAYARMQPVTALW